MKLTFVYSQLDKDKPLSKDFHVGQYVLFNHFKSLSEVSKKVPNAIDSETYRYLKILLLNPKFILGVKSIRKELKIPAGGFSYKEIEIKKDIHLQLGIIAEEFFLKKFNIPYFLRNSIQWIIFGGFIFIPQVSITIQSSSEMTLGETNESIHIIIKRNITKTALISFIKKNWSVIKNKMDTFEDNKILRTKELSLKIIELKDNKNISFKDIADILTEKHGSLFNPKTLKKKYYDAKKKVNSISRKGNKK